MQTVSAPLSDLFFTYFGGFIDPRAHTSEEIEKGRDLEAAEEFLGHMQRLGLSGLPAPSALAEDLRNRT